MSAECLYDGKPITDKFSWIPGACDPVQIVAMSGGASNGVILKTGKQHTFEQKEIVQVLLMNSNKPVEQGRESILSYSAEILNDNEVQLREFVTLEIKRNLTVFLNAERIYIRRAYCENALIPGETCHPHRYNGSLARSGDSAFFASISRKACPYLMPCEPAISCIGKGKCAPGYMSYYEPYRSNGLCDPLHYTLPDSTCFAPRCGMCDISDETPHFRLDGLCVPCPSIPWLMPAIMAFAFVISIASLLILSRSKAERNVLRIGVDYFQVLAMFRTAKVAWPIEINFMLQWLQLFQMDIDLIGPECKFQEMLFSLTFLLT